MLIDQISISALRVFESVYRQKSMSKAASELFMTQPGVSQHIKNFEETLDIQLFDRINRRLIPTESAHQIYPELRRTIDQLERSLTSVSDSNRELKGTIVLGMPIEFGNNVILPLLSKWSAMHPKVDFQINYDHAKRQVNKILDGSLDFAITDTYSFPSQLNVEILSKEQLVLCAGKSYAEHYNLTPDSSFKEIKDLSYISYLEGAPVLKQWFKHHQGRSADLKIRVRLMDVQGVARLVTENAGVGVLSMHMVKSRKLQSELVIFNGSNKPLYNDLNLVKLAGKSMGQASSSFIEFLLETFKT